MRWYVLLLAFRLGKPSEVLKSGGNQLISTALSSFTMLCFSCRGSINRLQKGWHGELNNSHFPTIKCYQQLPFHLRCPQTAIQQASLDAV